MGRWKPTEERIEYFKNMFPIKFNEELTLYMLNDDVEVKVDKNNTRDYYFNMIDNNGYKYYQNIHHVLSTSKFAKKLNRFFYNNPYTSLF